MFWVQVVLCVLLRAKFKHAGADVDDLDPRARFEAGSLKPFSSEANAGFDLFLPPVADDLHGEIAIVHFVSVLSVAGTAGAGSIALIERGNHHRHRINVNTLNRNNEGTSEHSEQKGFVKLRKDSGSDFFTRGMKCVFYAGPDESKCSFYEIKGTLGYGFNSRRLHHSLLVWGLG
jgi:hypothetical protein